MTSILDQALYTWNPDAAWYLVSSILIIVMGLLTVAREWGTRVGWLYLFYTVSLSGWILSIGMVYSSLSVETALEWTRLGNASIALLPAVFLQISKSLLKVNWIRPAYINMSWAISILFALLALHNDYFVSGLYKYEWGHYGKYGFIGTGFILYFSSLILYTIYCYYSVARTARSGSQLKKRTTVLFRSFLIGIFGTLDFLPAYGIAIPPVGFIFIVLLFAMSTYVTWRYRLVDISVEYAAGNLLELIKSPILVVDLDTDIRLTNDAAKKLISHVEISPFTERLLDLASQHIGDNNIEEGDDSVSDLEITLQIKETNKCFKLSISPLLSPSGSLIAYLFLLQDISLLKNSTEQLKNAHDNLEANVQERTQQLQKEIEKQKQTEEALITAKNIAENANQAKTEFLSRVSHELRTPLNALLGFTQLFQLDIHNLPNPEHHMYIEQMLRSGEQLHELIENILDLSNLDYGNINLNIEDVLVSEIIDEAVTILKHFIDAKNITIENTIDSNTGHKVLADRKRFKQIIMNLILNAIKYNHHGGTIVIDSQRMGDRYRISISDTGVGIADKDQEKVFEPFVRLDDWRHHSEGAGIGLSLSRHLAYEMRGNLHFTSELNVGSQFKLDLPSAQ